MDRYVYDGDLRHHDDPGIFRSLAHVLHAPRTARRLDENNDRGLDYLMSAAESDSSLIESAGYV
ncbi:hypothetical protein [Noviherbaspirillum saxi]|uniref:hypothetical protein n=1 Tax=Noviherbaspirillum saxi TaxID=2320863 RepID=UPI0011C3D153|nr:hypothetical protein [Noviherbaspirillum saxi]